MAARHKLETYIFGMKQAIDEAGGKVGDSESSTARRLCKEALSWLEKNSLAKKVEYENKLKELSAVCAPIMKKLHGIGSKTGKGSDGPLIEEID